MKKTLQLVGLTFFFSISCYAQTHTQSKQLITQFMLYSIGNWNIDTAITKYLLFRKEESPVASKEKRKQFIGLAIENLAKEIKNSKADISELTIDNYENADNNLKILNLNNDYSNRSYIVSNKPKTFVRYFLISNKKIESFTLFNKKAFLLLY